MATITYRPKAIAFLPRNTILSEVIAAKVAAGIAHMAMTRKPQDDGYFGIIIDAIFSSKLLKLKIYRI